MKMIKKGICSLALAVSFFSGNAYAAGFPTVDAAALTQRLMEFEQLLQQYETMKNQLEQIKTMKDQFKSTGSISYKAFFDSLLAQLKSMQDPRIVFDQVKNKAQTVSGRKEIEQKDNELGLTRSCRTVEEDDELNELCYQKIGMYYENKERDLEESEKLDKVNGTVSKLVEKANETQNIADVNEALYGLYASEAAVRLVKGKMERREFLYAQNLELNEKRRQAAINKMAHPITDDDIEKATKMEW